MPKTFVNSQSFRGRDNPQIFESIVTNKLAYPDEDVRYKTPLKLNPAFKDFLDKVLVKDPAKRLTIDECLRHPWVKGIESTDWVLNNDVIKFLRQFNFQSKLKKEITRILASNMTNEPANQILQHFTRLDTDGDGYLDAEELMYLLLDMGYANSTALTEAKEIIKQGDVNDDGVIDFDEFKAIWYRKILSTNDQYINRVFNVFDTNGDGQIDVNELKTVLLPGAGKKDDEKTQEKPDEDTEQMNEQLQNLTQMIEEVDQDGDHMISLEEFRKTMKEDLEHSLFDPANFKVGGTVSENQI